ncbi:MAG: heavy-metal-associated domain-containing protein [Clostridia bacterium]|nr:heavy-metal-associated domain-containing protein [Clostridia bacterium]
MHIFMVEGMHSDLCVKRIEEAFEAEKMHAFINLKEKTVAVESQADAPAVMELLEDLGFEPTMIQ